MVAEHWRHLLISGQCICGAGPRTPKGETKLDSHCPSDGRDVSSRGDVWLEVADGNAGFVLHYRWGLWEQQWMFSLVSSGDEPVCCGSRCGVGNVQFLMVGWFKIRMPSERWYDMSSYGWLSRWWKWKAGQGSMVLCTHGWLGQEQLVPVWSLRFRCSWMD